MKAILMSIQPKWCELIASGKKTIEVRKTAPKEVPFKVYMYCTKGGYMYRCRFDENRLAIPEVWNGKVIGEFICDRVDEYEANDRDRGWYIYPQDEVCMWTDEIAGYGKGKPLYGLHISELKIYDKPKELGEFKKYNRTCKFSDLGYANPNCKTCRDCNLTRPPQSWQYVDE